MADTKLSQINGLATEVQHSARAASVLLQAIDDAIDQIEPDDGEACNRAQDKLITLSQYAAESIERARKSAEKIEVLTLNCRAEAEEA